mgnify:CR=1 FL=1
MPRLNRGLTFRRWAIETAIRGLARAAEVNRHLQGAVASTRVIRDIPYPPGNDPAHLLDIYYPRSGSGPYPVLMYVHGGGFTLCSKETHRGIARIYASQGYLVVNVDYRLAPRHPFPAALEDVSNAFAWVADHIHKFGGDPDRINLAGESAGGNLVLGLTVSACCSRPESMARRIWDTGRIPVSVQVIAGLLQVSRPDRFAGIPQASIAGMGPVSLKIVTDVSRAYLGACLSGECPDAALADPLRIIENGRLPDRPFPAVFAGAGTADILVGDTRRLETALRSIGAPVEARYYPGEPHVFHFLFWRHSARLFWIDSIDFLRRHAPPPLKFNDRLPNRP